MRRRIRKLETSSLRHAHKFIVKRWENVREVRRHALAWLLLLAVLIGSLALQTALMQGIYQTEVAAESGTYSEGVEGQLNNLNPIYATTHPERSAARLLFSSLLTYDAAGALRNDLAQSWKIEEQGKRYVVTLRKDIQWSDGQQITASDVMFTVNSIKNADTRSPLYRNWRDIMVSSPNEQTVIFDLPVVYAPFSHFLTIGILPEHAFENIKPVDMRSAEFNRKPITSGPFAFRNMQIINTESGRMVVHMVANPDYHGAGPKLDRFQLHVYGEREALRRAFSGNEVTAVADFSAQDIRQLNDADDYQVLDIPVNNVAMAIFKTDSPIFQDVAVRKAFRLATDRPALIKEALQERARLAHSPIPPSLLTGGVPSQPAYNLAEAKQLLDQAGWAIGADGKRSKDGQPLRISVVTIRSGDYPKVLEVLAGQWQKLGATVETVLAGSADVQQSILAPRLYDVLIYELAVGGDPDVYAYWHSSQANMNGLNLANYKSGKADDALTSARNRFEPDLRSAKYVTFVEQWLADAPGVVLYQPTLHYVSRDDISIDDSKSLVDSVDRFRKIEYWSLGEQKLYQTR